jgi:hypothetical protein
MIILIILVNFAPLGKVYVYCVDYFNFNKFYFNDIQVHYGKEFYLKDDKDGSFQLRLVKDLFNGSNQGFIALGKSDSNSCVGDGCFLSKKYIVSGFVCGASFSSVEVERCDLGNNFYMYYVSYNKYKIFRDEFYRIIGFLEEKGRKKGVE